ncbi:MAG: hypothetical protein HUU20_02775 [Pirellulales bacterium]|nr:hypothetical protein [Pirellulales bacterium]
MLSHSRLRSRLDEENRAERDEKRGRASGVIPQNVTMSSQGTLPLMIPATRDDLVRMLTPRYGQPQARALAEDIEKKGIEAPRRGVGELAARGFFTLSGDSQGRVGVAAQAAQAIGGAAAALPDFQAASDALEAALAWLVERQDDVPVVAEALRGLAGREQEFTVETEYRIRHDRLMNLSAASILDEIELKGRKLVLDTDVPRAIGTADRREGLTGLYALGLVHHFHLLAGLSQAEALLHVLTFYEGLGEGQQTLLAVLAARDAAGAKLLDNADDFAHFLTKGAGAEGPAKRRQAALIAKLERVERAYAHRELEKEVLDEEGRPRLNELGLAGLREAAHRTIARTYSHAVEELAAMRVAAEMQEGGVELVMGFLGRAGLVEQLLMAAAEVVPTAELREPLGDLYRSFRAQRFSELRTPEFRALESRWQAAGAPLSRLAGLVTDPQVSRSQLQGAIQEFEEALDAFWGDAARAARAVARKNKDLLIAEADHQGSSSGADGGNGAGGVYETLQRDLATVREAVDTFAAAVFKRLELRAQRLPSSHAVWNVEMQRLAPAETLNLYLLNELLDPFLGETSDFRALLNSGGAGLHVTARQDPWLARVSHWVQALPAYAWYEIVDLPGDNYEVAAGCQRDILEIAFKGNTEAICANIEDVMHSEHAAIARGILATRMGLTPQIDALVEGLKRRGNDADSSREEAIRLILRQKGLDEAVEALATLVAASYRNLEEDVGRYSVAHGVQRITALASVLRDNRTEANLAASFYEPAAEADATGQRTRAEATALVDDPALDLSRLRAEMQGRGFLRRRELPCFHNLTTLGPGETTTYLKTWLETGLSLYLFCRDNGLEDRVGQRVRQYGQRMGRAAWRVVRELGLQGELFEMLVNEGRDPANETDIIEGSPRFAAQYPAVSIEVARICAIAEYEERERGIARNVEDYGREPLLVEEYLRDKKQRQRLEWEANAWVVRNYDAQNHTELAKAIEVFATSRRLSRQAVLRDLIDPRNSNRRGLAPRIDDDERHRLKAERDAVVLSLARKAVVKKHRLEGEVGGAGHMGALVYNRLHAGPLAAYTARQEIVSEYLKALKADTAQDAAGADGIAQLLNRPRYRYEADGPYRKFGMLYTPSRVDLGEGERHSVEAIGKVVTANDPTTLNRGSALYDLFNLPGTVQFPATAMGEFFKARENFFTRGGVFYLSLGEGMNIDALMMGDQEMYLRHSNLRGDRIVLPTGMSYRGFCVPKEFFLIYAVLVAPTNKQAAKKMLMAFAPPGENAVFEQLLDESFEAASPDGYSVKRNSFLGMLRESLRLEAADACDWEKKAAEFFAGGYHAFFSALGDAAFVARMDEALPALNAAVLASAPRIAKALEEWGITMTEEELKTRQLLFSMAAWVNKKLHGLEQVNRFGPYRTVKLMADLVAEARQRCRRAGRPCKEDDADLTMQMGGPYKAGSRTEKGENRPITDARLSAAADLALILSGKDKQILHELDPEGRRAAEQIRRQAVLPGCVRIAGTVTAKDVLAARQEIPVGEFIHEAKARLARLGISEEQLAAYCANREWAERFWRWPIPEETKDAIRQDHELARLLHLVALEQGGVVTSYAEAVQGCDVHVVTVGDPELLDLIDNLPEFVGRARRGNPDGLFVLCDGQVGARPRAAAVRNVVAEYKVKELFALEPTAAYGCLGLGRKDIQRWREEMETERSQAQRLHEALSAAATTGDDTAARAAYLEMAADVRTKRKAEKVSLLLRFGGRETKKLDPFLELMSLCLTNVKAGLPLERLDFATWLALGGRYLLSGRMSHERFAESRRSFEQWVASVSQETPAVELPAVFQTIDVDKAQAVFLRPVYEPYTDKEFGQKTGGGITVGKTEEETRGAVLGRRQERDRKTRRELMVNQRRAATIALIAEQKCKAADNPLGLEAAYDRALAAIGASEGIPRPYEKTVNQRQFSGLLYWAQVAGLRAIDGVIPDTAEAERLQERRAMRERLLAHLGGGAIDAKTHKETVVQDLVRLAELAGERLAGRGLTRETISDADRGTFVALAKAGELMDIALLLSIEYDVDLAGLGQERGAAANGLFAFFDQTMNAHHFDYLPFLLQPGLSDGILDRWLARGEKFELACERHRWLYGRVRKDIVERTAMADRPPDYQAAWLGNVGDWQHPQEWRMGLGVNVDTGPERFWFSYARLRDCVAMIRELMNLNNPSTLNGLPEIFLDVPPTLLDAGAEGRCANLLSIYPYGNTTMLVGLEQGVALEREGYNFMLCPFPEMRYDSRCGKTFLRARDALMYVSGERYRRLLLAAGADADNARRIAARVPPQGVLVALRFAEAPPPEAAGRRMGQSDAVIGHGAFFHFTQPLRGDIDRAAVALIQPIAAEAMTYLKSEIPQILAGTPVAASVGFAWSMEDTRQAEEMARVGLARRFGRQPSELEICREVEARIRRRIWDMLEKYPFVTEIIEKPEKESGGRGSEVLPILSRTSRDQGEIKLYGSKKARREEIEKETLAALEGRLPVDPPEGMRNLQRLASVIYETSKKDNVVVQGLVHCHVRMLHRHDFLEHIVARRARRGQSTSLDLDPQTRLFEYFRYILSRGTDAEFRNPQSTSHRICVVSGEAIGNAARPGSTLDVYRDEIIRPEFREPLQRALDTAFYEAMDARRRYLRSHWPRILRQYLVVNQRFGSRLECHLASFLRDRCGALADEFTGAYREWASAREPLKAFLSGWAERLLGVDHHGRDFTAALTAQFGEMATPLVRFLGSSLEKGGQLNLDIHYSMDDGMPMYLGDDRRNYCYIVARDEQGNIRLDDWGNPMLLPLADPQGMATAVELFDRDGNAIPRIGPDGKAAPAAIFETFDGQVQERELYDRDVSKMSEPDRGKFRVSCLLGVIIEFNPGAGLWRLYDLELQRLDPRRGGEGVLGIFRPLGERARLFQEAGRPARSARPLPAAETPGACGTAYYGAGDALFTEQALASPGSLASFLEIAAAKAREDMNQGPQYAFCPDDVGLVLSYAAAESLLASLKKNGETPQSLGRERVTAAVREFLSKPQLASTLQERLKLAEGVPLTAVLSNSSYREAIGSLVDQYLKSGDKATGLRIAPEPLDDAQAAVVLGNWKNCGLVFEGGEMVFADTVAAFQMDADRHFQERRGLNFLGIRKDWLTADGRAAREALVTEAGGLVRKVAFAAPVCLQAAGIFGLDRTREQAAHRELSDLFEAAGIPVINPYGAAAAAMDSKSLAHARCAGVVEQPLYERIDLRRPAEEADARASIEAWLCGVLRTRGVAVQGRKAVRVVIKPNQGTEGVLARAFRLSLADGKIADGREFSAVMQHLEAIRQAGFDAIAEEERGNVTCDGGKRVVLRVNVCETPNGYRGETGFARVAPTADEVIVSCEKGAATEDINLVLQGLECRGKPLRACMDPASLGALIHDAVASLKASACRIAEALQMRGIAGVDFVLEAETDRDGNTRLDVVFLEANARPALLSAAREIVADVAPERDGEVESSPLVASPGFIDTLYARAIDIQPPPRPDVAAVVARRPAGQARAIAEQLKEMTAWATGLGFDPERPVGVGIAGGRLRRLMMHPDMGRFFGPALQEPTGAAGESAREQIAVLVQPTDDNRIYVDSENPEFQESRNWIAADLPAMYPGSDVTAWSDFERFGCAMTREILTSLGYPRDQVADNMRRTVALVANAIASLRTFRSGPEGERVQEALGRKRFRGLRVAIHGNIPRGGFSSSSAVTVAALNAIDALYGLGLCHDTIVDAACQAEYGTGVKAGSLDHTAIQKGRAGESMLISSNPRERYRTLATFDVSTRHCGVLFPFSVARDKETAAWSNGMYAAQPSPGGKLTSGAVRKMTGKAAEIAAILLRIPLDRDLFQEIEEDLAGDGVLDPENLKRVYGYLRQIPLGIAFADLRARVDAHRDWYVEQLKQNKGLGQAEAEAEADRTLASLFDGWQEPVFMRTDEKGEVTSQHGVPLRAMVAYLYCEEAKNLYLLTHPEASWIEYIARSQLGDRSFDIDFTALPDREEMLRPQEWEEDLSGPGLMEAWLARFGARPFDYNKGLDDASLAQAEAENRQLHLIEGSNFYRGLALIDLVEAMLQRAFGDSAVAVRVNAAGQGDYFQVHFDLAKVTAADIKHFMDRAIYRRFGLDPEYRFVDVSAGGPAVGIGLAQFGEMGAVAAGISKEAGLVPQRLRPDADPDSEAGWPCCRRTGG